ncbi:MAG: lamin tail domain-containing protein, partial [Patescibacteria group bacterium]
MRRIIKTIVFISAVIISSALFVSRVFVYDTNIAHPGLTKLAAELYNQQGGQLTSQEIKWLMQGAIEEDTPFRWMNHFFDPIHNVGLKSSYDTAKIWAGNAANQASYAKGDQTWQRAIYYWQTGNKEKALIALGHILHLLEDMTVPAHTRDDAHPEGDPYEVWVKNNFKAINGEWIYFNKLDKYFDYLANYSNNNFYSEDTIESGRFNKIFITREEKATIPEGNIKYLFTKNNQQEYKIFRTFVNTDWDTLKSVSNAIKLQSVNDPLILSSHFSLLAPKAIGAGAGVIKLFFEETQKQQAHAKPFWQINPLGIMQGEGVAAGENLIKIYQNISGQVGNLWGAGKKLIWNTGDAQTTYNFFTELFATNMVLAQELKNLEQTGQNLAATPIKIIKETGEATTEAIRGSTDVGGIALSLIAPRNDSAVVVVNDSASASGVPGGSGLANSSLATQDDNNDLLSGFLAKPTKDSSPRPQGVVAKSDNKMAAPAGSIFYSGGGSSWSSSAPEPASGVPGGFGGEATQGILNPVQDDMGSGQNDSTPPPPLLDITPPAAPVIIDPSVSPIYTTSSIRALSGLVSTDTIKLFLNGAEIAAGVAVWNTEVNLTEGENIFAFSAQDVAGNTSLSSSVKIIKDTTGPSTQISVTRKSARELEINWQGNDSGSGVAIYDIDYQTSEIGAVTSSWTNWKISATSTAGNFVIDFGKQYQFRARAADALDNIGDWTQSRAQEIALPGVVINEIAWAGTKANANDEWMELYNTTDYDFDASGWFFTDGNDIKITFATGTIIKSRQYFLLERTNDQTISDLAADLIYTGSLHNSGEKLQLKDAQGRLLDDVDASKKWFAGKSENEKDSMEKIDPLLSGNLAGNWQSVGLPARRGHDAKNNYIAGTPQKFNSSLNYLNGVMNADRILSIQFSPYFLGNFTVATGTILTIPAGVIIKAGRPSASDGFLNVYGALIAQGTVDSPIIFTSYRDASQGGNTNIWSDSQTPLPGDWSRLQFYIGSRADIGYTKIFYGNYRSKVSDPNGAILAEGAEIIANGLTVSQTRVTDFAVNLINSSSTISHCVISQNSHGLVAAGGLLFVDSCIFSDNGLRALFTDSVSAALRKNLFQNNGWDNTKLAWWNQITPGPAAVKNS